MAKATLIRTATLAALVVTALVGRSAPVTAADPSARIAAPPGPTVQIYGDKAAQFMSLGVGKSVVVDLPADIKDVLVADPKIANAVVRTSRRAYIIGVAIGQTNVYFFDSEGRQLMGFDIAVTRDLNGIRAGLKRALPGAEIDVEGLADGIMLTGSVASPTESQQAYDFAARLAGDGAKVVNGISVRGRDQVMLKVTVAEVQRDVIKQLGINLDGSFNSGQALVDFANINAFPVSSPLSPSGNFRLSYRGVNATLRAMERAGIIRTLAEPNLTAISGETANFLAGGEFPIPAGFTCDPTTRNCQTQIQFKKFGVGLNFTPVVMSEGRISLKVLTEVSELSNDNALSLTQQIGPDRNDVSTQTIPSIKTRRAETTVEIPSGGSLAMAGMIQEQTKQQINGFPGLMNIPVLGALFKSRDYVNRQTELMVLVTPYIVRAVAQKDLSRPDDGYADASDASTTLLGRFNRLYGVPGQAYPNPNGPYRGNVGFILD